MRIFLSALLTCLSALTALAEIPSGYYAPVAGKKEGELKTALHNLLYNHTEVSSYTDLPRYFQKTDCYPTDDPRYGQWWDMYGNIPLYMPSFKGLNREHSFPKSWWGGLTDTPAYVDLYHLYPSEAQANMAKSNYPLGTVQTPTYDNGVTRVGYPVTGQGGGAQKVFEPADEYKGDFARTYFYFVTTYQNLTWKYTYMVSQNAYPTLNRWSVDLLLKWHRDDPVSQKEIDRNEAVYNVQTNRNAFIDYPELAEYLWGSKVGLPFNPADSGEPQGDPHLITPVKDMTLDFGETAVGQTGTAYLQFRGENIKGNLTVTLARDDKAMFDLDTQTISASAVNSHAGYQLKVLYKPTAVGEHKTRLIVSDGGLTGSFGVSLLGQALPAPTLTALTATEASDVTADSYRANWNAPAEVVDYYIVTRSIYTQGQASSEDLLAEDTDLLVEGCTPGSTESYHVRSSRLGFTSEPSNEVWVNLQSGLSNVLADNPLGCAFLSGGVRLTCAAPHTGCRVYDTLGRLVMALPVVENNTELLLERGAYLIVTDQCAQPLRVLVRE